MSLEVRQMIVKTSIVQRSPLEDRSAAPQHRPLSATEMRKVLEACRRMVSEMLRERRER